MLRNLQNAGFFRQLVLTSAPAASTSFVRGYAATPQSGKSCLTLGGAP